MWKFRLYIYIFFTFLVFGNIYAKAQPDSTKSELNQNSLIDTSVVDVFNTLNDSSKVNFVVDSSANDSTHKKVKVSNSSGLDTVVIYSAKDSVSFKVKSKIMKLRGDAKLNLKEQKLEAEYIEMDFGKSQLKAKGMPDSTKKVSGYPKFVDGKDTFVGSDISFNFKSKQGVISLGETEVGEGYYFGNKIKRVSDDELFVQDGCYTTCDDPHPHFYFGSPKMKVIVNNKVFIDPIIFYVMDVPLFYSPVGLFFPNNKGRQSGLIIPGYYFSKNRGVTIEGLGYYFALSDYYDTKFTIDYYTKGGYNLRNFTRWELRNKFKGQVNLQFGKTRYNPDNEYTTNWSLQMNHSQTLIPQKSNFVANLNFSSQDFNRNVYNNQDQRLTQNISSDASIYYSFDNGASASMRFSRNQNIITDEYSQTLPGLSLNMPQWYPFKKMVTKGILRDLSVNYSGSANFDRSRSKNTDSTFKDAHRSIITHNPSISVSPKLGYFSITPSISIGANNYFRRLTRKVNPDDSSIVNEYEDGFFSEGRVSMGVNVSTKLYGMAKPKIFGITAFRHLFQPRIGFTYSPDLSYEKYGFYGYYYDPKLRKRVQYSRFESDGGGIATRYLSSAISYGLSNSFDIKVAQGDTSADKSYNLLNFDLSGSYDVTKDSLKFSDISTSFRTPAVGNVSINGSANFTLYDEAKVYDYSTNSYTNSYTRINKFLAKNGKGIARLTYFSLQLSTSFSGSGSGQTNTNSSNPKDSVSLGERFQKKMDSSKVDFDYWGEKTPGSSPISVPWNASIGLNFSYSQPLINQITRSVNLSASFGLTLTPTWSLSGTANYDFINMELLSPSITVKKDLHCWEFMMNWYPVGYNRGFYFKLNVKAPTLQDLKYDKRESPIL